MNYLAFVKIKLHCGGNELGIIYKVTNIKNGKFYIGMTEQTLEKRKNWHIKDAQRKVGYFHNSLKLYGFENFIWEEIDTAETREELSKKEIFYIKELKAMDKNYGYNNHKGGDGGAQTHPDVLKKISKSLKGKMAGDKNPMYGKPRSIETRKKISEAHKKKVICIETNIIYESGIAAEKATKIDNGDISKCCRGKKNIAGGFHWQYFVNNK